MRDAVTPRPNGGCSATTPLFYFSLPFFTFFIFTEYFLFFFSSTFLAREVPGNPSPPPHPPRSPLGPFTSLPFSHPFSSLPFFLQLEANLPRIPPSPQPAQRSQQVLPTGQRRALLEGMVPHPVGRLQSHPRGWGGGPCDDGFGGGPSLFAALHADPRLWDGARREHRRQLGVPGTPLCTPPPPNPPSLGCCRYFGAALPGLASPPVRMPQGTRRVVPCQ